MMKRLLLTLLTFCLPVLSLAAVPAQLIDDLKPIDGYVVMAVGEEFLVDLDASKGLREGDILSVIISGEKIVHPITHEILGGLDEVTGFLQVTRVKSGYSYAKPLHGEPKISRGDKLRRFEQVPSRLSDADSNRSLLLELKQALPHLDWRADESSASLLVFKREASRLTVRTSSGQLLLAYAVVDSLSSVAVPETAAPVSTGVPVAIAAPGNVLPTGSESPAILRQSQQQKSAIWQGPEFPAEVTAVSVADLDGDGQQEIITTFNNELILGRVKDAQYAELSRINLPSSFNILSLDTLDLDKDGQIEIYLSLSKGYQLISQVLEVTSGDFQVVIKDIPWYLRKVVIPGRGETLLAQKRGSEREAFYGQPFRVERQGDRLIEGETYELPDYVNFYGFTPVLNADGSTGYLYFDESDYLRFKTAAGVSLWESSEYYGGSEVALKLAPASADDQPGVMFIKPRIMLTSDGNFLLTQNDGSRLAQRFRMYKNSRLVSMSWNGFALEEDWKTTDLGGHLVDFSLADVDNDGADELLLAVKYSRKGIFASPRSALVVYELN